MEKFYALTHDELWFSVDIELIENVSVNGISPVYRSTFYRGITGYASIIVGEKELADFLDELHKDGYRYL